MPGDNDKPNAAQAQGAGDPDADPAVTDKGNQGPAPESNEPPKEPDTGDKTKDKEPEDKSKEPEGGDKAEDGNDPDKGDDDPKDKPLDTDVWGSTGDEVGDQVLTLLQNSGISQEDAKALMYDAVKEGDVSKVDRAALEAKVGKTNATLILAGAENFVTKTAAKNASILKEVHGAAGSEENWTQLAEWSRTNIPEAELNEYRQMIDNGGAQARFAVSEMAAKYNADDNNTTLGAADAELSGTSKVSSDGRALTRTQYAEELGRAHDRGASDAEIQEIQAARARGRKQGI